MKNEEAKLQSLPIWLKSGSRFALLPTFGDVLLALLYGLFVRISISAAIGGDVGALILAIQELSIVVLVLTRRRAHATVAGDSPPAVLAWCGTILPLVLRPSAAPPVLLGVFGSMIQLVGGLLVLAATLRLGRSFGIVAANRGIQTEGLYRVVRHPIYAAYVLAFGGFVLAHPTVMNGVVLAGWLSVQILRIRAEERLLMQDVQYSAYAAHVRYRLLPGWW
jgi:protein-S-isoprenylcysteine O-methyltransferase Ste14